MATDPSIITDMMSRWQAPAPIAIADPLTQYAKLQALRTGIVQQQAAQQNLQAGALELQQKQQAFTDQQALDAAYKGAITTDANGNISYDRAKVLSSVPGHLAPGIQKTLNDMDQAKATLDDTKAKAQTAQADLLGSMLLPIKDANYDPDVFNTTLTHAAGIGAIDSRQAAAFRAQLGPNPTPDAIKAALTPFLGSPGVQKIETERAQAAARQESATAATGQLALAQDKERLAKIDKAKQAVGAATSQDELDQAFKNVITAGATPAEVGDIPRLYSPAAMSTYNRGLQTAEQRAQSAQAAATAVEMKRYHDIEEKQRGQQLGIEQQNAGINAQKFAMEFGGDAVKGWAKQIAQNPDTANQVPAALRTPVMQQFTADTGLAYPKPLTGTAVDQERASRNALDAVAQVKAALADPEIQSRLGPILGRLGSAEQAAGTAIGLSPAAEAKAQQLRTNMRYLVFQEGKALLGGRMPQQLMESLEKSSPNVKMDAGTLNGALAGVTDAANRTLDQTYQQRVGEGATRPAPQAATGGSPGAGKSVTTQDVKDYATKHNLSYADAEKHVKANGFTIQ